MFSHDQTLADILRREGIEPDQRLATALAQLDDGKHVQDLLVLASIIRMNALPSRYLTVTPSEFESTASSYTKNFEGTPPGPRSIASSINNMVLNSSKVFEHVVRNRSQKKTLSVADFLRGIGAVGFALGDNYTARPFSIDLLAKILGGDGSAPVSHIPALRNMLMALEAGRTLPDDFQYMVAVDNGRLVFRVASVVNDYVQLSDSGLLIPQRALVTHLGDIGFFTEDQVKELEDLMNSPLATEGEFQKFFERYPHFLRQWDHREVHPHVMLTRDKDGPLVPDFILTNREAQSAAILDLKRTLGGGKKKLIRRQDNRVRFADAIQEARAQLRTYGRWFEDPDNRRMLKSKVGMEIYSPRLMVVIGRSSEFQDGIERATLRADNPDIDIVTYDDIARRARDRMVIIKGS